MTQVMDVFYVPDDIKGYTCAVLDVQRSWDGTLYGETNVLDWAGRRRVYRTAEQPGRCSAGSDVQKDLTS